MTSAQQAPSRRRTFRMWHWALPSQLFGHSNMWNCLASILDSFFYILGIFLIIFASVIIVGLTYSFFYVVLPMIERAHPNQPLWVGLHITWVLFLLVNVLSNYILCITANHKGNIYNTVVRELAQATGVEYPETPDQVDRFRQNYQERMLCRMQMRQQLLMQKQEQHGHEDANCNGGEGTSTITHRKVGTDHANALDPAEANSNNNGTSPPEPQQQKIPKIRKWMIMGPQEWGFCDYSHQPKPPRSHYDHVTKQLVLNMDHYCPWMFNTVGYFNYRYFYSFLLYVFVAMVYGSIITYKPFLSVQSYEYRQQLLQSRREGFTTTQHLYPWIPIPSERAAVGFSFLLCLSIGFAVLTLLGFHTYLLLTAQTTIEFHANWASRRKAKKLNKKWKNPYDLGWKRNVQQVYGAGTSWFWSLILPSGREPDYLPLPLPGKEGLRPGKMANINKDVHANTV